MSDSAKRKARTDEEMTDVQGLLEFRRNLTKVMNAARNGNTVKVTEFGFDRKVIGVYTLTKVNSDTK